MVGVLEISGITGVGPSFCGLRVGDARTRQAPLPYPLDPCHTDFHAPFFNLCDEFTPERPEYSGLRPVRV